MPSFRVCNISLKTEVLHTGFVWRLMDLVPIWRVSLVFNDLLYSICDRGSCGGCREYRWWKFVLDHIQKPPL